MTPHDLLCSHSLLDGFSREIVHELSRYAALKRFAPGEFVIRQGDEGDGLYGVLSGRLATVYHTIDGNDLTIGFPSSGDLFGEFSLLDGDTRSASVIARDMSNLFFISRSFFVPFFHRHPELSLRMVLRLVTLMRRGTERLADMTFLSSSQRLAKTLVALGGSGASIGISQQELSSILGVSREVVNRQLSLWRASGLIAVTRGSIDILNDAALRRIAEGDPSSLGPRVATT